MRRAERTPPGTSEAISIDREGFALGVRLAASPNFDERPADAVIDLIVVHAISLPPGEFGGRGIEQLFLNQLDPKEHPYYAGICDLRVSAHFLIRRDGEIVQFVSCAKRAWHAGASSWNGRERCNDFSIGIELEGCDDRAFEAPQYDALAALIKALYDAYPIAGIAGHSDIAPSRKTDPGPCFDWARLRTLLTR
jgi:N-acetyl-anhydromuramoyl-L-alanine amidase